MVGGDAGPCDTGRDSSACDFGHLTWLQRMRRPADSHTGVSLSWRIVSCKPQHPFRAATRHVLDMATWRFWPLTFAKHHHATHDACKWGPDKSAARLSVSQQDNMGAYKGSADPRPSHRSFSSRLPVLSLGSGIGQKRSRPCHHGRRQLTWPRHSVFAS